MYQTQPNERFIMKAFIKKDRGEALWLVDEKDNEDESVAHPILEDEVEAIKLACQEYLFKKGKL